MNKERKKAPNVQERRERDRQQFKQTILTAARDIARNDGWQAVTIRKVAGQIAYSPAALYEYFPSKEAILRELMIDGFRLLADAIEMASSLVTQNDGQKLKAAAQAYWNFAFAHPDLYQVMHGLGGIPFGTSETPQEAVDAFIALRNAVLSVLPHGETVPDLDSEVDAFWAMLHGMVSLTMASRIKGGKVRAALVAKRATAIYLAAWQHEKEGN